MRSAATMMGCSRFSVSLVGAAVLAVGLGVTGPASAGGQTSPKVSCARVAKTAPDGVAATAKAAKAWQRQGGTRPRVDAKTYASFKSLDRDRDGVICGRQAPEAQQNAAVLAPGDVATLRPIDDCKLASAARQTVSLGLNRPEGRTLSKGKVNVTFLFVDFPNAPATQSVQDRFTAIGPGAIGLLSDVSYGQLTVMPTVAPTWIRMPKTTADYGVARGLTFASHKAYIQDAIDAAGAAVDLSRTDALVVVAPATAPDLGVSPAFVAYPATGVSAAGRTIDNAVTIGTDFPGRQDRVLAHEFLHTLGLVDLYAFDTTQPLFGYTGPYSVMGDVTTTDPGPLAWERWALGWITDRQVACLGAGMSTVTLDSISRPGTGVKTVVVPRPDGTAVAVELRTTDGVDAGGPSGVVVYTVDPRVASGQGPVRVTRNPDDSWLPVSIGSTTSVAGVTITALSGGRVQVAA